MRKLRKNRKTIITVVVAVVIAVFISLVSCYVLAESLINSKGVYYEDNSSLGFNNVQDAIDGTCTRFSSELSNLKKEIINEMYPIGSIYISTTLSTPEQVKEALGGEWETYGAGRTLIGVGNNGTSSYTIGKSGGVESVSTKLTTENLPSHTHVIPELSGTAKEAGLHSHASSYWPVAWGPNSGTITLSANGAIVQTSADGLASGNPVTINTNSGANVGWTAGAHTHSVSTTSSTTTTCNECKGTAVSISTIQPYITVYMYQRKK